MTAPYGLLLGAQAGLTPGSSAAASSFALPGIGLGLGALFLTLGVIGARNQNELIRNRAIELQKRLNTQITRTRVEAMDAVRRRSAIGTMAIAEARSRFGTQTGLSISERLAALSADLTVDTDAIGFALQSRLEALQTEKLDLSRTAQSEQTPVGQAAIQGFAQGFGIGSALDTSLAQLKFAQTQTSAFNTYTGVMGGVNAASMMAYPRSFGMLRSTLSRTRVDTDLKLDLSKGIESFLSTGSNR